MLGLRLSKEMENRLDILSKKTQRPKSFYGKLALDNCIDQFETSYLEMPCSFCEKPHIPNDITAKVIEDGRKGIGITKYTSWDDFENSLDDFEKRLSDDV